MTRTTALEFRLAACIRSADHSFSKDGSLSGNLALDSRIVKTAEGMARILPA